jgi:hypothetical protein
MWRNNKDQSWNILGRQLALALESMEGDMGKYLIQTTTPLLIVSSQTMTMTMTMTRRRSTQICTIPAARPKSSIKVLDSLLSWRWRWWRDGDVTSAWNCSCLCRDESSGAGAIYPNPDSLGPRFNLYDFPCMAKYEFSSRTCQNNSLHPTTTSFANLVGCPHFPRLHLAPAAD